MFSSRTFAKLLIPSVVFFAALGLASPSFAAEPTTCEEQGMTTWSFGSGILAYNQAPHELCRDLWNAFASKRSASSTYWFDVITSTSFGQSTHLVRCYTCTLGMSTAPAEPEPLGFDLGGAGILAGKLVDGTVTKVERRDDLVEGRSVYVVDVVGDDGQTQVLVDGHSGEAEVVEARQRSER